MPRFRTGGQATDMVQPPASTPIGPRPVHQGAAGQPPRACAFPLRGRPSRERGRRRLRGYQGAQFSARTHALEDFRRTFQALNLRRRDRGLLCEAAMILVSVLATGPPKTQGQEQQDHARHEEAQVQRERRHLGGNGRPLLIGGTGQERREERDPVPPLAVALHESGGTKTKLRLCA